MADRWDALVRAAAAKWSRALGVPVPVPVVHGIIHTESRGNPAAARYERDREWSRGLMQVKHSTALELGVRDPRQLYVPAIAIDAGTHYLARQLRRYGGRVRHAVAAYNAGTAFVRGGRFTNQAYVDEVLAAAARRGGGALAIAGVAIAVAVAAAIAHTQRRAA